VTASQVLAATPPANAARYALLLTTDPDAVRAAQRLRYRVFADELGAKLTTDEPGFDVDRFDAFCDHLIVREEATGEVVGTYRMLPPERARAAGALYAQREFMIDELAPLRRSLVETGRSCVHPDHRSGGAILALWGALAEFMVRNGLDTMIGCASVSMRDGGHVAASLWEQLRKNHLAPIELQVQPRLPLPVEELQRDLPIEAPALIKGYLRCGAKVLGPPAWDPDFNTADLPMLMRIDELPARYKRHFQGR
jgi:putative hemolysin